MDQRQPETNRINIEMLMSEQEKTLAKLGVIVNTLLEAVSKLRDDVLSLNIFKERLIGAFITVSSGAFLFILGMVLKKYGIL